MLDTGIDAALRRLLCFFSTAILLSAGGCGWLENQYTNDPVITSSETGRPANIPDDGPFVVWRDCIPAERGDNRTCDVPTLRKINTTQDPILRDRLQDHLLFLSERMCETHRAGIVSTQAFTNFGLNTVTTGLAAVAAIVVAPAANILAAGGAFVSGTRSHFNADIYQKFIAPAVIKKIELQRENKLKDIIAKRKRQPSDSELAPVPVSLADYTVEGAIVDVERYNQYCSFTWALASLSDQNPRFEDTVVGLQKRIEALRKQQAENIKNKVRGVADTNAFIERQIMFLQHQMLTAPTSVDSKLSSTPQQ
jgi:hypothetical protein